MQVKNTINAFKHCEKIKKYNLLELIQISDFLKVLFLFFKMRFSQKLI